MDNSNHLILASNSKGRRWLLEKAGFSFQIQPADIPEPETGFSVPRNMVQTIAWLKASAIAERSDSGIIIAADTIGWLDGKPLLKPRDRDHARDMLQSMAGRIHELWTGVVVWKQPEGRQICWQERSLVRMGPLNQAALEHYLAHRIWEGCSGSYAISGPDDPVVRVVEGSLSNVVGLPMESLEFVLDNYLVARR
jgi:septum formation protein